MNILIRATNRVKVLYPSSIDLRTIYNRSFAGLGVRRNRVPNVPRVDRHMHLDQGVGWIVIWLVECSLGWFDLNLLRARSAKDRCWNKVVKIFYLKRNQEAEDWVRRILKLPSIGLGTEMTFLVFSSRESRTGQPMKYSGIRFVSLILPRLGRSDLSGYSLHFIYARNIMDLDTEIRNDWM